MKEEIYKICTQLNDGQIVVVEATEQLLLLFSVVGRSEQLLAFKKWEAEKCKLPWDASPKQIIEQYLIQ